MTYRLKTGSLFLLSFIMTAWAPVASAQNSGSNYEGPIIDMHVHTGGVFPNLENLANPATGKIYKPGKNAEDHKKLTYEMFEKYNVVKAMVSGMGPTAATWHEEDPDRVIPGIMLGGMPVSVEQLRKMHAEGKIQALGEVGYFYQGLQADDEKIKPYFDLAEELGIPVGYHIMPGGGPGSVYKGMSKIRAANANPMQIEEVLVSHPNMKIYMMHAGWPYLEDLKALMFAHPQLYVEISAINWLLPEEEFSNYLKGLIDAGYGKRILYGTDQMEWPEIFDDAYAGINSIAFLTDEQKADIFYHNAAHFLELPKEEIARHWEEVN